MVIEESIHALFLYIDIVTSDGLVLFGFIFQINEEAKKFCFQTGLRVVVAYGGTPMHNQVVAAFLLFFILLWTTLVSLFIYASSSDVQI